MPAFIAHLSGLAHCSLRAVLGQPKAYETPNSFPAEWLTAQSRSRTPTPCHTTRMGDRRVLLRFGATPEAPTPACVEPERLEPSHCRLGVESRRTLVGSSSRSHLRGWLALTAEYVDPFSQVALDIEYHKTMLELHLRVNPKEVIVGWYSTGAEIVESDALIHVRIHSSPH